MPQPGSVAVAPGPARAPVQYPVVAAAALLALALVLRLSASGWRLAALFIVGMALGVTLRHAAFGFTSAYRRLLLYGEVRGVRAQLLMLAAATALFAPVLAADEIFGRDVVGAVAPLGTQVVVGAFAFGVGMQLAGGCGSGALYTVGGGSLRMLLVLAAFCGGSFWASLHMAWWQSLPGTEAVVLGEMLGWPLAAGLQVGVLLTAFALLGRYERKQAAPALAPAAGLWRGPWPLLWGALALAGLNFVTLLLAGHPWSITWAFALWGAKAAAALGWDSAGAEFWNAPFPREALAASVLDDITSVMDLGLILGATLAAGLGGRFRVSGRLPPRAVAAALLGGLLMGYGARIAFGCNIGAFFSGAASTSLHGWLWIAAALAGNWMGVWLRPRFGRAN